MREHKDIKTKLWCYYIIIGSLYTCKFWNKSDDSKLVKIM